MSAIDLSQNNLEGLISFMQTTEYEALGTEEKAVLTRYAQLEGTGTLDKRTVVQISKVTDPRVVGPKYPGGGTVKEAEKANYTDGVEPVYFIGERKYLFFADPEKHMFYFMKNPDTFSHDVKALEVLDISAKEWVRIDDLEPFFGNEDNSASFPGLIKANFLVAQFNRDEEQVAFERDKIGLRVEGESLAPKAPGEKYYCEEQKNSYCQLHAANAFLGYGAVRPNALSEYVSMRAATFSHSHVEGLAQGGLLAESKPATGLLDIEYGVDLGMVVDFMHYLESEGELRGSVEHIEVGELAYTPEKGLEFVNHGTGTRHKVDEEFLASRSRSMLGTFAPVHARALRKNTDGSWTEVDSLKPGQKLSENFSASLIETILEQQQGNTKLTLPCAFM
ncbi:hypothetical protein [Simkania sp.]|uniref:hypothetical protein n=1 Tax=Simkania sp. TaxID=34094 RepID=UPI003B529D84